MLILVMFSILDVNLSINKDTFLVGEDILIRWEIVNGGENAVYYEKIPVYIKLTNDFKLWNSNWKEVKHPRISETRIVKKDEQYKLSLDTIGAMDTVSFEEVNLIGLFGGQRFPGGKVGSRYIEQGEYFFSLFYRYRRDLSENVWSDTMRFTVKEPKGKEKEAWELYKMYKRETFLSLDKTREIEQLNYALKIIKKYPNSVYTNTVLNQLVPFFSVYRRNENQEYKEGIFKMRNKAKELLNYLKQNIDMFSKDEKTLQNTLWCIINGELMLGTSKEQVKSQIKQLDVPLDREIKEFLEIDE